MTRSHRLAAVGLLLLSAPFVPAQAPPAKAPAERLDGPPVVTAKAWAVADGKTGKLLWGAQASERRPTASTTKVMTAWIILQIAEEADAKVLDEVVTFSERAAKTPGSTARLEAGEKVTVGQLLYGLMLPSGNDAAVALAEHFGPRFLTDDGKRPEADGLALFVAEMNRQATELGLKETSYRDPHGLSRENVTSTRDLARLAATAYRNERFRTLVSTPRYECKVRVPGGGERTAQWVNTNRLLGIDGYDGVKTGTTTPAGNCLVASGKRGGDHLLVVVLGSSSVDGRYADTRNLFRWAWLQRGHKPDAAKQE